MAKRRGIVTRLFDTFGNIIRWPGRHTRSMAYRGGSPWEYSPWSSAGPWVNGRRRRGRRYRVTRRR